MIRPKHSGQNSRFMKNTTKCDEQRSTTELFATTKTQKYERLGDNIVENLIEINYTSGSYITYKCSKLIAEYLKSLFRMNFLLLRLKCFQSNYEIHYLWVWRIFILWCLFPVYKHYIQRDHWLNSAWNVCKKKRQSQFIVG